MRDVKALKLTEEEQSAIYHRAMALNLTPRQAFGQACDAATAKAAWGVVDWFIATECDVPAAKELAGRKLARALEAAGIPRPREGAGE